MLGSLNREKKIERYNLRAYRIIIIFFTKNMKLISSQLNLEIVNFIIFLSAYKHTWVTKQAFLLITLLLNRQNVTQTNRES